MSRAFRTPNQSRWQKPTQKRIIEAGEERNNCQIIEERKIAANDKKNLKRDEEDAGDMTGMSRAERVHELVQRLADAAADAEGSPRRAVPRLDNDLALTDQLRVVTADVLAASGARPDMLADLASAVRATSSTLN